MKFVQNIRNYTFFCIKSIQLIFSKPGNAGFIFFLDNRGPTFNISFENPLAHLGLKIDQDYVVYTSGDMETIKKSGLFFIFKWLGLRGSKTQLVIFSRFPGPYAPELLETCRNKGIKTINHLDDFLISVPEDLGAKITGKIGQDSVIEERKYLLKESDLIYASTTYLNQTLAALYPKQKIYSGIYASCNRTVDPRINPEDSYFTIGYMASKGHRRDLLAILDDIKQIMRENSYIRFEVFGTIAAPDELVEEFGDRVKSYKAIKNYAGFVEFLSSIKWDLGIIPLIDDHWNRCKAPTKFIEYTMAGIPVVASDVNVYNSVMAHGKTGILVPEGEWNKTLSELVSDKQKLRVLVDEAQVYCRDTFSLDNLSGQVKQVFKKVGCERLLENH